MSGHAAPDLSTLSRKSKELRERARLTELARYDILDTPPEVQFDRIASLARVLFDTPMAAVTLVDRDRQWFKAASGLSASQTPREQSFCSHAIALDDILVVADARTDDRFAHNPLVTGEPHIRFYAGAPVRSSHGANIGAVCVISDKPRADFSKGDQHKLQMLAGIVETELELHFCTRSVQAAMSDPDLAVQQANMRIRNSRHYTSTLGDPDALGMTPEKLSALAMAAWTQYNEAGVALGQAVTALGTRLPLAEYRALIANMPGLAA